ncbi:acyclic terpene utilization AtuA family protein [Fusibacter paucivorans]|uniref:Acyclic terpene utilization AtuA family protein n=1 Tax=Fusibacter paucivorans TaxID=76009 RepID=A0ABS5PMG0_9FIRM|nr:acyclic terpene utilization AtuA family protein [Fusibacter paucivorans]MBS7526380.1 acyclic terpene utilization AtuA family protein [Fusibacter paucivorans]
MKSCKVLMPIGALGGGINPVSFENGMNMKPDVIAIDGGSTDSGPAYLATGASKYSRAMLKHDLEIAVIGGIKANIPVLVGSCSTCGTDSTVDLCAEIVVEIMAEQGLKGKVAKVYSQQSPDLVKQKWDDGKIKPLGGAPDITRETFDDCDNIVALMGSEPFIEAINQGADVVLCGRTTDTAIMAAVPLMMGCDPAAAWHGAKIAECGSQCTDGAGGDGVFLIVDEEGFYVKPLQEGVHCTPYTVSAHLMYENADPFKLVEPSGVIMAGDATYEQVDDVTVYVTGTKFEHTRQYSMKLEGARASGHQAITLVGIADELVLKDPDTWMNNLVNHVDQYVKQTGIPETDYSYDIRAYGYNGVVNWPKDYDYPMPREIGVMLTVTAKTEEIAIQITKTFNPFLLHFPADFKKQLPSFAFAFSPSHVYKGQTYEFMLNHIVEIDDPLELVKFEYIDVK